MCFLASFLSTNLFAILEILRLSVFLLQMCNIIRWFILLTDAVNARYVLTVFSAENDRSLTAVVVGRTRISLNSFITSEKKIFPPAQLFYFERR